MKRSNLYRYIAVLISAIMLLSLFACDIEGGQETTAPETQLETEKPTEEMTSDIAKDTAESAKAETESQEETTFAESESATEPATEESASETLTETESVTETETETEPQGPAEPLCEKCEFKTVKGIPTCKVCGYIAPCRGVHGYTADENGHWKPACEHCGKASGKAQDHEYTEKIDDAGDAWVYAFRCSICKYIAYEQYVPYEITSFYSAGELSGIDTDKTFSGEFRFEMGTGFSAYTMSGGGSGTIKISDGDDSDMESGRYLVMKVRLPASQSGFTASISSVCAAGAYTMAFSDLRPGWVTVIADMTKAVSTDKYGAKLGYVIDENEEYYLASLKINGRVQAGESFDIAYVMICDTIEEANSFAAEEKQIYTYTDIVNEEPTYLKRPCTDKDGNEIIHTFESDENGHTVAEACYQCGLRQTSGEPHTFTQMRVNGELTYACSICEYLQYGYALNKYISAEEINKNALVYYKVDRELKTEEELAFTRFKGKGQTAQVIFARNNWATTGGSAEAMAQIAAAFPVGRGDLLVIRMRTNNPETKIRMMLSGIAGKEKEVIIPTSYATVISAPEAETVEYGWTTYVIDLPRAIPDVYVPDENGEYKLHNFYFQMGAGDKGEDYSTDVYYDINFAAFVDSWDEIKRLVPDETVVKVNATNNGTIVKTQEQECVGEHSFGENVEGNVYTYLCVNCGKPVKTVTLPSFVKKYISGYEAARNAVVYALSGTRDFLLEGEDQVFGRVSNHAEIWWMRSQNDYALGSTGAALDGKVFDVGEAKYFVLRLRTDNNAKNMEFYISTTGKNGTPRTDEEVTDKKPITVPTTSGSIVFATPINASTVGEWTTYVFDLEALIPEHYVKDAETGHYLIDTFGIAYSKDYNADIDFMAFVEGGWEEIDALTSDETVVYTTHYKNKTYSVMNTATGKCAGEHSYLYTGAEQADGTVTYTYACGGCGDLLYSKTVPASVTKFFSGEDVAFGATTYAAGKGTKEIGVGDDGVFYGRVGDHGEIWWMRHQQDFTGGTGNQLNNKFIEVGAAKYLVVRVKSSDASKYFQFYMSTTGKNGEGYVKNPDGTEVKPTTTGYASLIAPMAAAATTDEWITFVFDLEEIFSDYYVKDAESGEYILDTFGIAYASGYTADVEYIAFVEGDIGEVCKLVDDETFVYVTHAKDKTYEVRDGVTGAVVAEQ